MQQPANKNFSLAALRRHYSDPHKFYDELRAHDGLYFDPTSRSWLVTGYKPVVTILSDPRFSSNLGGGATPAAQSSTSFLHTAVHKQMVFMDGAQHQQAQQILLKPLAQMVKKTPATIRSLVSTILADAQHKGELDLVKDFASPVSLLVIAQVLGIPTDDQEGLLQVERWSDTFTDFTSGYLRGDIQEVNRLVEYFRNLIAAKRRSPSDDLISVLIEAHNIFPEDDDLIANCIMIFGAGHVTSKKVFGNGLPLMMSHWSRWRDSYRENTALPRLLGEEMLRMITPTRYLIRQASEDIDLSEQFPGKHQIQQGQKVFLFLEAANYDPAEFAHPAGFDPYRPTNKHIAFGHGPHRCPGASLGRLEIQIALEELLTNVTLGPKPQGVPAWNPNPNLGGYTSYTALVSK